MILLVLYKATDNGQKQSNGSRTDCNDIVRCKGNAEETYANTKDADFYSVHTIILIHQSLTIKFHRFLK